MLRSNFIAFVALSFFPVTSFAYIGPGMGLGAAAAVLGIFAGFVLLAIAVIWYPLKAFINRLRGKKSEIEAPADDPKDQT